MPNYANITIIGHLGRDPETKEFGGNTVTSFSIAVTQKRKGKDNVTTWYNCAAWNKTGQLVQQYLKKGSTAMVTGTPALETYTNKDGVQKSSIKVDVKEIQFLDRKGETAAPGETAAEETLAEVSPDQAKKMIAAIQAKAAAATDSVPF